MSITVTGPAGGKPYDTSIAVKLELAVNIMATKLGIAHIPMEFDISIGRTVDKTDGDCKGWCWAQQVKKNVPWEVSIFVMRKKRSSDMIKILAHEMIHVRQFVKDGLNLDSSKFKGKKFVARSNQSEYWDSPWEKEAYLKEKALAEYYFKYVRNNS